MISWSPLKAKAITLLTLISIISLWVQHASGGAAAGEEGDDGTPPPAQPAPSILAVADDVEMEAEEEGGERPRGQWSPLPLEPEEYEGREVLAEEEDTQQIQALRQKVSLSLHTCGVPKNRLACYSKTVYPMALLSWLR